MRPLTEAETKVFFEKLSKFIGKNIKELLAPIGGVEYVFRLHRNRVLYMNKDLLTQANMISREKLVSSGVIFGNFTKAGHFLLKITCLDYLAQYSMYKVWLKQNGEMNFLYGNHVLKHHILKMTEDTPPNHGAVILNHKGVPLGFGTTSKGADALSYSEPQTIVVLHQSDTGEYLRGVLENVDTAQ